MIPTLLCSAMIFDFNKIDFYRLVLIKSDLNMIVFGCIIIKMSLNFHVCIIFASFSVYL